MEDHRTNLVEELRRKVVDSLDEVFVHLGFRMSVDDLGCVETL
jgi:hypothetical protein